MRAPGAGRATRMTKPSGQAPRGGSARPPASARHAEPARRTDEGSPRQVAAGRRRKAVREDRLGASHRTAVTRPMSARPIAAQGVRPDEQLRRPPRPAPRHTETPGTPPGAPASRVREPRRAPASIHPWPGTRRVPLPVADRPSASGRHTMPAVQPLPVRFEAIDDAVQRDPPRTYRSRMPSSGFDYDPEPPARRPTGSSRRWPRPGSPGRRADTPRRRKETGRTYPVPEAL